MASTNIRRVKEKDLNRCFEIEKTSYAGDEAATKEKILKRIQIYADGFIVLENDEEIIGFINSGATHKVELSEEAFKELIGHDPSGTHIVIMSVVVDSKYHRQGFANLLLKHFIGAMKAMDKTDIYLICQTELIDLYVNHGFKHLGESESNHGGLSWHEMSLKIK